MSLELSGTTPAIKGVAGSVAAPALTGDDANTGISFPAADTIKFSTNGDERLSITNSGLSGDGSGLTGISGGGITQADQWRLSTHLSVSSETILTSNWERNDTSFAYIGSGFDPPSSGNFTFPATGIYLVMGFFYGYGDGGGRRYLMNRVFGTTDNSNYVALTQSVGSCSGGGEYTNGTAQTIFDVTDVTTHKIQMRIDCDSGAGVFLGQDAVNTTGITFIRLGDT